MTRTTAALALLLAAVPAPAQAPAPADPPPLPRKVKETLPPETPAEKPPPTPPDWRPTPDPKAPKPVPGAVAQGMDRLRAEREALARDRQKAVQSVVEDDTADVERAELRRRINALAARLAARPPVPPTPAPTPPPPAPVKAAVPETLPADPLGLARVYFRSKDYDAALRTYRLLDAEGLPREDRAFVRYMTASCLRLLGKRSEALAAYREVADAREDEFLAECAVWQIGSLRWQQEVEAQLEESRRRRQPH